MKRAGWIECKVCDKGAVITDEDQFDDFLDAHDPCWAGNPLYDNEPVVRYSVEEL